MKNYHFIYGLIAASAFSFIACTNNSASADSDEQKQTVSGTPITLDEEKQEFYYPVTMYNRDSSGNYSDTLNYDRLFKYEFLNDTLIVYPTFITYCEDSNEDDFSCPVLSKEGIMCTGGTNGNLTGTWVSTPCQYEEGKTVCYDKQSQITTFTFTDTGTKMLFNMKVEDL